MSKALFVLGILALFFGCASIEKPDIQNYPRENPKELFSKAEKAFSNKQYDRAVYMLTGLAYDDPSDWKVNLLLAKAKVEKAAILKLQNDNSYKKLLREALYTAKRLRKINIYHAEPYYIAARVYIIDESFIRARRNIKNALSIEPRNPVYLNTLEEIRNK